MSQDDEPAVEHPVLTEAERAAVLQREINQAIAELREMYRLMRLFPFYRYKARNTLGDMLNSLLKAWCHSQGLPDADVHWGMRRPDFERFLRRIAGSRGVLSVEDALDVLHVNRLHDAWLRVARERDFDLGSRPKSLFELNLAWALKTGGAFVRVRWEHATPYRAA
jgi:hypothetical protein